jgi:hypothetical protein
MIYKVKLINYADGNDVSTGIFETDNYISLQELAELYNKFRNDWFGEDYDVFTLEEYMKARMKDEGIRFYIDYPTYDCVWDW